MNLSRLFRFVNRANSVLLLFVLVGAAIAVLLVVAVNFPTYRAHQPAVEVVQNDESGKEEKLELVLGDLTAVHGHTTRYVELNERSGSGKFSSKSRVVGTRNVLFFTGTDLNTHWLFNNHSNFIKSIKNLEKPGREYRQYPVLAIRVTVAKTDTDGDGELGYDDETTLALIRPDGKGYREIDNRITRILDTVVSPDGKYFEVLMQKQEAVWFKRFSLATFGLVSEKKLVNVSASPEGK